MNAQGLLKRVLRDPLLAMQYHNPKVTPLAARPVLEAAYTAIACQDYEGQTFRLDPDLHGYDTLPDVVAQLAKAAGAEEEVAQMMERLAQVGLIRIYDDNSISIPTRPGVQRSASARNGQGGGRPRAGETKEEARARRERERSALGRQQGAFALPIAGGAQPIESQPLGGRLLAEQLRKGFNIVPSEPKPETQNRTQIITQDITQGLNSGSVPGLEQVSKEVVVVVSKENLDSKTTTTTAFPVSAPASAAVGKPGLKPEPKPNLKPKSEPGMKPSNSPETRLTRLASERFRFTPHFTDLAPAAFKAMLGDGFTEAQIEEVIRSQTTPVHSAAYFARPLAMKYGRPDQRDEATSTPAGPVDPRVLAEPAWAGAERRVQDAIATVLDILELPTEGERHRRMTGAQKYLKEAFSAVAAVRPEVETILAWEPRRFATG